NFGSILAFIFKWTIGWFTKNITQGAATIVLCCLTDERRLHGQYFEGCQESKASKITYNEMAAEALWSLSEDLCGDVELSTR
ncbi:hypothetical protein CYMTET_39984, partial [Cymbomonas tetramitiformis]